MLSQKLITKNVFAWEIDNGQTYLIGRKVINEIKLDENGVITTPIRKFKGDNGEMWITTQDSFEKFQKELKDALDRL